MPKRTSSIGLVGLFLVLLAGCAGVTESTMFATFGTSLASPTAEGTDSRTPHDLDSLPTIGETVEIPGQGFTVTVLDFARWNILPVLDSNCADPGERFVTVKIRLQLVEGVSDSVQTGFWVLTDEANSEAGLAISQHPCGFDEREWPVPSLSGTSDSVDLGTGCRGLDGIPDIRRRDRGRRARRRRGRRRHPLLPTRAPRLGMAPLAGMTKHLVVRP